MAMFGAIAAAGSLRLGADANWDLRNYHLYNPWALLHDRWQADMGWNVQWFLNPLPQLPYYALVRLWPDDLRPVTALMGIPGALVAWALLLLYRELHRHFELPTPLLTLAWGLSCTGAVTLGELGTTFNDLSVAFIVLLGVCCVLRGLREGDDQRWPALGFFAFGAAMGLKITFGLFVLGPALAWFMTRPRFHALWPGAMAATLGLLLTGGWWFVLLQLRFDSPLFPFFNDLFHSPWWIPINERDPRFDPNGVLQWLFYPFYWWRANILVSEVPFADGRVSLGLLAALAALWPWRGVSVQQRRTLRFMAVMMLLTYLLWLKQFAIYRYMLPLEMLSPWLLLALGAAASQRRAGQGAPLSLWLSSAAVALLLIITTQPPNWGRVSPLGESLLAVESPVDTRKALVVVAQGDPPLGYLAAALPTPRHFVSAHHNLHADTRTGQRARALLAENRERYWVTPGPVTADGPRGLAACFGLQLQVEQCQRVQSSDISLPSLMICPLADHPHPPPPTEVCP
ncbi:hypothetical protein ACGLWX_03240 [Halomonas sp. HMF6819]|uniref:hypothetical protein n=1 Tax=Halomonas sp. HMF6819 TaxID=3373085 RepID=UPI0037897873